MTVTKPIKIALVGVGKIARDQHIPSITSNPDFELAAAVSRNATVDGVDNFTSLDELLAARPDIPAVALCMPPQARFDIACAALEAGKHVLLEKPPGATLSEVESLIDLANASDLSLFATWHSRFGSAVGAARDWLAERRITQLQITWKEDVHRWHPGQAWIWQAGGLGVFDPGINALSILTEIMPHAIHLTGAELEFPSNCDTPIAARLEFAGQNKAVLKADFDWRQTGPQTWEIAVETETGAMQLLDGGSRIVIDGTEHPSAPEAEYDAIYARFAALLAAGKSDVDLAPLRHVADAFMLGKRLETDAFFDKD